jgi:hypothetical protein
MSVNSLLSKSVTTRRAKQLVCEQRGITVSEEELQAAGDEFRQEYKLLGASATLAWFSQHRITVQDWA